MKITIIVSIAFAFAASLFLAPTSSAKEMIKIKSAPAKQFVCHITYVDCSGDINPDEKRAYGHVIYVSENAVPAHCYHGDHFPGHVVFECQEDCASEENTDKCVANCAIGKQCSRLTDNDDAVAWLCGEDFDFLVLCPPE